MLILQNDLTMITVISVQFLFQNKLTLLIPEDFQYLRNCKVVFLCLFVFKWRGRKSVFRQLHFHQDLLKQNLNIYNK